MVEECSNPACRFHSSSMNRRQEIFFNGPVPTSSLHFERRTDYEAHKPAFFVQPVPPPSVGPGRVTGTQTVGVQQLHMHAFNNVSTPITFCEDCAQLAQPLSNWLRQFYKETAEKENEKKQAFADELQQLIALSTKTVTWGWCPLRIKPAITCHTHFVARTYFLGIVKINVLSELRGVDRWA